MNDHWNMPNFDDVRDAFPIKQAIIDEFGQCFLTICVTLGTGWNSILRISQRCLHKITC
ncbi:hypothetical protein CLV88_101388 [Shimia abyssi]|uniref:Uncharacterized protein n=1 Tax=Shimia abyssi TaxID=1662395 RepID=A0A2P8FJS5_9RHOB|nr:hypothetical protein CLV88_101388 [Shimia abyssi]